MSADVKAYALAYAQRGWHVLPVTADKRPLTSAGFKDATVDARVIEAWWEGRPDAQLAVATGASRLIVVDIDPRNGGDVSVLGEYPETLTSRTQSGGMHVYFSGNSLRSCKPWPGVDVKADSGYVLCPPSRGYEWIVRTGVVPLPERLREELGHRQERAVLPDVAAGEMIPEGSRDDTLLRLGCQQMRRLVNARIPDAETHLLGWLHLTNVTRCVPPLNDEQVNKLYRQVLRYDYAVVEEMSEWRGTAVAAAQAIANVTVVANEPPTTSGCTDMANAARFVEECGWEVRWVPEIGTWYIWNGRCWDMKLDDHIKTMLWRLPELIRREAARLEGDDQDVMLSWARDSESNARVTAALQLIKAHREIISSVEDWDKQTLELSCVNGVINLRTGELEPHVPGHYNSYYADVEYDPDARDSRWETFLKHVTAGDAELEAFLQRAVGYTLTGVTNSEAFFLIVGQAKTGKSTFVEAIQAMMGPYADVTNAQTFCRGPNKDGEQINRAMGKMRGKRLIYVDELSENAVLDESLMKQVTSAKRLEGRRLNHNAFSFVPTFKVWLATNHAPGVKDDAIWRRVYALPFTHLISEPDVSIKDYLMNEARPAILRWAVEGCRDWLARQQQLEPPPSVLLATSAYQSSEDWLGAFLESYCEIGEDKYCLAEDLQFAYNVWAEANGESRHLPNRALTRKIRARGITLLVHDRPRVGGKQQVRFKGLHVIGSSASVSVL